MTPPPAVVAGPLVPATPSPAPAVAQTPIAPKAEMTPPPSVARVPAAPDITVTPAAPTIPSVAPTPAGSANPSVAVTPAVPATPSVALTPAVPVATTPPAVPPAGVPTEASVASASVAAPATRPAVAVVRPATRPALSPAEQFDRAEAEFARITNLPLDQQPLEGLRWRYRTFVRDGSLPADVRQTAEARVAALQLRIDARGQMTQTLATAAAADAKQQALRAEQQELADRIRRQQLATFAAVGTLRVSSLQQTGATLYRLTDPGTGPDAGLPPQQRPEVHRPGRPVRRRPRPDHDRRRRRPAVRHPRPDAEVVDAARVNNGVTAAISPPSLLKQASEASLAGN